MSAAEIAAVLGRARREGRDWRCECPMHGGASLTLADGKGGCLLVKCWAGCNPRDILSELRRRGLIDGRTGRRPVGRPRSTRWIAPTEHRAVIQNIAGDGLEAPDRSAEVTSILQRCVPAVGTLAERYFASRGLHLPASPDILFCDDLTDYAARRSRPGIVAVVRRPDGTPTGGIQRIYLRDDGSGKAAMVNAKMALGPIKGGAVMLGPAGEVLMVGEGIESVLSGMQSCDLPGWATLGTSGLKALPLPPIARTVIILADNDRNGAGERAAQAAAQRWLREGRRVRIAMPPGPDTDFNDLLLRGTSMPVEAPDAL